MTIEELILDSRYYNGKDQAPSTLPKRKVIFWDYERVRIKWILEGDK